MHVNVKSFFDAASKPAIIPLVSTNLTQKYSQDNQLELLHQQIKFYPDQLKNVGENDADRFCFVPIMWPPGKVKVSESGTKW